MATQTVEFFAAPSQTITAKLFAAGSDTQVASVTATEATNRKGVYTAAYTDVAAGTYRVLALVGTTPVASWWVDLTLTTATFQAYEMPISVIADSVWDEPYNQHTTAGTFGKLLDTIRKSNLAIDGTVTSAITPTTLTFSSNVSATTSAYAHAVLLFTSGPLTGENSPIISYNSTNGVFVLEEPLTAAPTAGDEFVVIAGSHVHSVDDIQSGLALQTTSLAIKAKTDLISTGNIQFVSPVALNGSIATPIFIGDDYKASIGRAFEWNITARTGYSAATATCRFGGYSEQTADAWNVSGSVTDNGNGTWKLSFDLPKATTSGLSEGFYRWSVELVNPGGDEVTEVYNSTANRLVEVRAKQT